MSVRLIDEEWKMKAHLKIDHRKHECQQCSKSFKFVDMMFKHVKITHDKAKMYCHYFNNQKVCPYENDCVFLH